MLAYIDPGSGSLLFQVILVSVLGGVAAFWMKIKNLFRRRGPDDSSRPE